MSLDNYLRDLILLESSLEKEIDKIIKEKQGYLVSLIKNRLFQRGVDSDGKKILPDYKPSTIKRKKEDRQRTSHVTLRDTGDWYSGIFVEIKDWVISVDSTDGKTPSLIDKYGQGILGFTKQEQDEIIFGILEPRIQKILNSIGKNGINL
jgi:hypothetical protein